MKLNQEGQMKKQTSRMPHKTTTTLKRKEKSKRKFKSK